MAPQPRHPPPHRPQGNRVLATTGPPPVGRRTDRVLARRLPSAPPPLRAQGRTLPRLRRHSRSPHLPPPPHQMKRRLRRRTRRDQRTPRPRPHRRHRASPPPSTPTSGSASSATPLTSSATLSRSPMSHRPARRPRRLTTSCSPHPLTLPSTTAVRRPNTHERPHRKRTRWGLSHFAAIAQSSVTFHTPNTSTRSGVRMIRLGDSILEDRRLSTILCALAEPSPPDAGQT